MTFDPDAFERWTPSAQQKALEAIREAEETKWRPFYCPKRRCNGKPHDDWQWKHARADQHPPAGDWLVWLLRGGRGSGKTRTGAEWVNRRTEVSPRIALVAQNAGDARDVMVEGDSGILACARPGARPEYEPSKKRLTWPNGAMATIFSAEEPDRLRGPQHYDAWLDEPAHMPEIEEVWSNLLFGLRLGQQPRICCTTTPIPIDWIKDLIKDPDTVSVVASTYANIDNLAPKFAQMILKRYEGTRKGQQEIHGLIAADVEGALWESDMIEAFRVDEAPDLERVAVGVDPAGTSTRKSDSTGIVAAGVAKGEFYVLEDFSGKFKPSVWAERATSLLELVHGDVIVAENNYGGEMVESTLEAADQKARIKMVNSRRGKIIRADPIVALYEKGKVHHVKVLQNLEDQQVSWVPGNPSPDRLDALVHVLTDLSEAVEPGSIAAPPTQPDMRMLPMTVRERLALLRKIA